MTYRNFERLHAQGCIRADIDTSKALGLIDHLPEKYQYTLMFYIWIWLLTMAIAVAIGMFTFWWLGPLSFALIVPILLVRSKIVAARCVIDHAQHDEKFFNMLVEKQLLIFTEK